MNNKDHAAREMLEALEFRRTRLSSKMRRLDAMISGRDASILPLVQNEGRAHDEARTWQLVDALVDAMERWDCLVEQDDSLPERESAFYRSMIGRAAKDGVKASALPEEAEIESAEHRFMRWYRQSDPPLPDTESQKNDRRAFYRSFLYCALRVVECDPFWLKETNGSYDDLLDLAKELRYTEAAELHFMELYNRKGAAGTFGLMDDLYEDLSGRFISEELTPEERQRASALHPDQAVPVERLRGSLAACEFAGMDEISYETSEEDMQAAQEFYDSLTDEEKARMYAESQMMLRAAMEDLENWVREDPEPFPDQFDGDIQIDPEAQALQDYLDSLPQEERQRMMEENAWYTQAELTRYGRLQDFPEKKRFCQEYLRFRKLYFSLPDRREVPLEVERMLDAYLCARDGSPLLDDDRFFSAYVLLGKIMDQVRQGGEG